MHIFPGNAIFFLKFSMLPVTYVTYVTLSFRKYILKYSYGCGARPTDYYQIR